MQLTTPGKDGASLLILVLAGPRLALSGVTSTPRERLALNPYVRAVGVHLTLAHRSKPARCGSSRFTLAGLAPCVTS